jgi:predicted nucleic acid-binding protein
MTTELADTSAWVVSGRDAGLRRAFDEAVARGEVATCDMVKLELLHGARNSREFAETRVRLDLVPQCPIGPAEFRRALDVYEALARQGGLHHRRVKHPDLLIAAAAESAGVPVLHHDRDFDAIGEVTGQAMRWIASPGSV